MKWSLEEIDALFAGFLCKDYTNTYREYHKDGKIVFVWYGTLTGWKFSTICPKPTD
jgi:hypothetical protein